MTNLPKIPCIDVAEIDLPKEVGGLYELAYNFWWSWTPRARRLFNQVDPEAWTTYRNPVQVLLNVDPKQWEQLLHNESFMSAYRSLMAEFERAMRPEADWFETVGDRWPGGMVAYFSCEYGLHESFNIYSGGLGVLSGDHCKSASDLGLPFVGVGLLYRHGYFRQTIDADGFQQHIYPRYDFHRLPVRPVAGPTGREVVVPVELPGRTVQAKLWLAQVGRVPLILLDTDIPQNDPGDRPITGVLYVRGRDMRLAQEMVLGVGGARALEALDIAPAAWHLNEGHSAFLLLERLRRETDAGAPLPDRLTSLRSSTAFTTHTPVPAGNERFDHDLAAKYLEPWAPTLGVGIDDLLSLGSADGDHGFNLTALALRAAGISNGVSQLHAEVSNRMWQAELAERDPIVGITNGVHSSTWLGTDLLELFNRHCGLGWRELVLDQDDFARQVQGLDDAELWQAHLNQKQRLVDFVRVRLRGQFARHGRSPDELREVASRFDPEALIIGFARRFATYKRASLLFSDVDRLAGLVGNAERPVQILISGKAHPADRPGQELIQGIFQLAISERFAGRVYFLEDYDMDIGRRMVQGVDVWLNTPRRPMEASGTSGQKAGANGILNLSVLDGWWPEALDERNGWAIGTEQEFGSEEEQDRADAEALYRVLETSVIPAYYGRDDRGVPTEWVSRMKDSIATILPQFASGRMVREYVERCYLPVARREVGVPAAR